ncbi:hypothetical protein [Tsukamurella sp. NPDC003166]|uniref:hypothetical protein n=1 Tax=Tsukamurella sp. NPDC003166 TaxID=3154444 RepID=UPI0033AE2E9C
MLWVGTVPAKSGKAFMSFIVTASRAIAGATVIGAAMACTAACGTTPATGIGSSGGDTKPGKGIAALQPFSPSMSNAAIAAAAVKELGDVKNHGEQLMVFLQVNCTLEHRYGITTPMALSADNAKHLPVFPDSFTNDTEEISKTFDAPYQARSTLFAQNGGMDDAFTKASNEVYTRMSLGELTYCETLDDINKLHG